MITQQIQAMFPKGTQFVENIHSRSKWKSGAWGTEPDRIQWRDPTGRVCLMRRNHMGNWCGYVGVEPGHPWHGKGYGEVDHPEHVQGVSIHGGLTYASTCDDDPVRGVCHVPQMGEADHLYWLGFDCAHGGDGTPDRRLGGMNSTYRDVAYMKKEVENLAGQANRDGR